MPKFTVGDQGLTLRLTLPKGQVWPGSASVRIEFAGQLTKASVNVAGDITSNTSSLACVDYVLTGTDFVTPDNYDAISELTAPGLFIRSQPPYPVWEVFAEPS